MSRQVQSDCRAFPNAYLEVDEPPRRFPLQRALALVGMLGVAYFSITIVLLHFEPTGYDPVSQFVSDYAVGAFALEMSLGFFVGGIGVTGLGLALVMVQTDRRAFRAGAFMTVIVGLVMFLIAGFPTDIEGAASTIHGIVHSGLSAVVFTLGPASMVLISYAQGRRWFGVALSVLAASFVFSALTGVFVLGANGLAERFFIAVLFGWWMVAAYRALRNPVGLGGMRKVSAPESLFFDTWITTFFTCQRF